MPALLPHEFFVMEMIQKVPKVNIKKEKVTINLSLLYLLLKITLFPPKSDLNLE